MASYSLSQLSDALLKQGLVRCVAQECASTAELLAHIAEFDARQLYRAAAYPSMYAYCVGELRLSEDAAYRRIRAARTAREYPAIFAALADGRLNLNTVLMVTPHLSKLTRDELLALAENKTRPELELLLARRFPQPDLVAFVQAVPATSPPSQPAVQPVANTACQLAPAPVGTVKPLVVAVTVPAPPPRARLAPLAPERFALQLTIAQSTHDKLRYAQALLSHQIPSGDLAQVLDHVLNVAIGQLERRKFAASDQPRASRRESRSKRAIPAHVRRAVWKRDGGQCTFVGENGHRCEERRFLEFDHVREHARGGGATLENLRLRCRAHNQFTAEQSYGAGFMHEKRRAVPRDRPTPAPTRPARPRPGQASARPHGAP